MGKKSKLLIENLFSIYLSFKRWWCPEATPLVAFREGEISFYQKRLESVIYKLLIFKDYPHQLQTARRLLVVQWQVVCSRIYLVCMPKTNGDLH